MTTSESLPTDLAAAHTMILAERAARLQAEAVAASAKAEAADAKAAEALISYLKLEIEKLGRQIYGSRSERKARLLEQMELQLEELEATATEGELAAERAVAQTQTVKSFQRRRPSRKPFPEQLPRERVVVAAPESCPCCGSSKLSKLGEDITETLEVIPRQWKVIQTVREKFSCRDCETITQPPAPFHVTPRGFAGPNLLAMILFEKFGQHQPLNRQSERYAREGIDLSLSTLADQVGACATAVQPLYRLIERHVLASERLHGDDTPVPILAKGQTVKGHIWTYVRDDRPFGGRAPPAALYYADGRSIPRGISKASPASCRPTPIAAITNCMTPRARKGRLRPHSVGHMPGGSSLSWRTSPPMRDAAHATAISPIALEAVKRIDAMFDIERGINGQSAEERLRARKERSVSLLTALEAWLRGQRAPLSNSSAVAKPIDYMLRRWDRFARFVDDGRICLTNNAAERALRGFALGRKSWLFAGSERGADRAAIMATLIMTAKLNDVDPQAWLADILTRIASTPQSRLNELLPGTGRKPLFNPRPDRATNAVIPRPSPDGYGQVRLDQRTAN